MNKYRVTGFTQDGVDTDFEIEAETFEVACRKALEYLGLTIRGPL